MSDYIEREAAVNAVLNLVPKVDCDGYCWVIRGDAARAIDTIPAADVRPVVRGKWIDEPIKGIRYHCSVCQGRFDYTWRFCPNCGAKMEES